MKFLFITPTFHTNQYHWTRSLIQKGHEVHSFIIRNSGIEWHDMVRPNPIPQSIFSRGGLFHFKKLYREMKKVDPDVVVIRGFAPYAIQSILLARMLNKKPLIYDQSPKWTKNKRSRLVFRIFRFLRLIAPTRITPVLGEGGVDDPYAVYIPFVADFDYDISEKVYSRGGRIHIISVGKLWQPRKNHDLFLRAIKKLRSQYNIHLYIIGSLPEGKQDRELIEKIKEYELSDHVAVYKNQPFEEVAKLYKQSDLFVLPSSSEPAAYSILEAMNYGLPVICSDSNGTRCYLEQEENGYIFKSNNLSDLVEKIERVIANKDTPRKMGQKSYQLVQKNHTPEQFYQKFMRVVEQL